MVVGSQGTDVSHDFVMKTPKRYLAFGFVAFMAAAVSLHLALSAPRGPFSEIEYWVRGIAWLIVCCAWLLRVFRKKRDAGEGVDATPP